MTPTKEQIEFFSDSVKDLLSPQSSEDARLVQKGMMLYRQGLVKHLQITQDQIMATVQDVTPCYVTLELEYFSMSECSCPQEEICRHQMAVFFAAYSRFGSVSDWLNEWREPMKEQKALTNWGLQMAKDLIKGNGVLKPNYERWVQSFEASFDALLASKKYTNPFVIPELFEIYQRRVRASSPVEQEWRFLYELVSLVVSFRKLAVLSEQLKHEEHAIQRAYIHLFHAMMDDADDLAVKIGVQSLPFAFDEFIDQLRGDAFELLTCVSGLEYERVYLYRLLWVYFFKKKPWQEEEVVRITAALKALDEEENPLPLMIAGIHLNLLRGKDELALDLVGHIEDEAVAPYMVYWIDLLSQQKAWKRVGLVIDVFLQKVKVYLEDLGSYHSCATFSRNALRSIAPYCSESDRIDVYERALLSMLPYSFGEYEHLLFERGQYERWGELHAFIGFSFYDLPKERVKLIEKEKPEVLLGMLHQTVQHEIDQKNRSSYKLAVRHLKKLRTLYKKLKRVDDWEFFLDTLMERTKRLRAFHEECKRSKLIEA